MSLIPMLFEHFSPLRPSRILNQHFGMGLDSEDHFAPINIPHHSLLRRSQNSHYRPWRSATLNKGSDLAHNVDKENFEVNLDVKQFAPNEISVSVTGKNEITVEGKHEEKEDGHGFISRHFVRKYIVPENFDMDKVESRLSSEGVLTITAPKIKGPSVEYRNIPITQSKTVSKVADEKQEEINEN